MINSLVTGGAGFIGSHLTRKLLSLGHNVIILDNLSGGLFENIPKGAVFVRGDIQDRYCVRGLFEANKFDYVYHLAAYAAEGLSHYIRRFNYHNNVIGSINIINDCIRYKVKRLIYTSSIAVYGHLSSFSFTEDSMVRPIDPYGIAKLAVEQDIHAAHEMFGLEYTIFRPHNVYGEYQNIGDRYRNVVGIFMNQIMKTGVLTIFGDGSQTRAFSYVGDIIDPIANCISYERAKNDIFNIGGNYSYSVLDLAHTLIKMTDKKGIRSSGIVFLPVRKEVLDARAYHDKVRVVFGNLPSTPLEEGLAKMWKWAEKEGPKETPKFKDIELTEGLPEIWVKGE